MVIRLFDHIVCAYYDEHSVDHSIVGHIVQNTVDTWQPDRKLTERGKDTEQGKIAEEIVERFLGEYYRDEMEIKSYDEIRNDNYKKHAPFDFLMWKKGTVDITPIVLSIQNDISNTPNEFVRISENTRRLCRYFDVKIAEVKSTKIRNDLKLHACFHGDYHDETEVRRLFETIRQEDDIFCYPHYKRSESSDQYTLTDYCEYVKTLQPSLTGFSGDMLWQEVLALEKKMQCCDVIIRVYLDPAARSGMIIGWMKREDLLDEAVQFKRMWQKGKSERALYFAKSLSQTEGMDKLLTVFHKAAKVYANPYTQTNFYHKSLNCKYINRIRRESIIEYDSEEEAIEGGRYTRRCLFCYR